MKDIGHGLDTGTAGFFCCGGGGGGGGATGADLTGGMDGASAEQISFETKLLFKPKRREALRSTGEAEFEAGRRKGMVRRRMRVRALTGEDAAGEDGGAGGSRVAGKREVETWALVDAGRESRRVEAEGKGGN